MRNRELINNKLEQADNGLERLRYLATEGKDISQYFQTINQLKETISDLKTLISNQEITPEEINPRG